MKDVQLQDYDLKQALCFSPTVDSPVCGQNNFHAQGKDNSSQRGYSSQLCYLC